MYTWYTHIIFQCPNTHSIIAAVNSAFGIWFKFRFKTICNSHFFQITNEWNGCIRFLKQILIEYFFFLMIHISFSLFLIHESTLPRSFTKGHNVNLPAVWCNGYISVWSFAVKLCVVLVHFTWCFIPVREPLQFVPSA